MTKVKNIDEIANKIEELLKKSNQQVWFIEQMQSIQFTNTCSEESLKLLNTNAKIEALLWVVDRINSI